MLRAIFSHRLAAHNQTLSVPAARVTLKYNLLSYVSNINGMITRQRWEVAARVSSCFASIQFIFRGCEKAMMMSGGNSQFTLLSVLSDQLQGRQQMIRMWIAAVQNEIREALLEKMCLLSNLKAELEPAAFGH